MINTTQLPRTAINQDLIVIRPLNCITAEQADEIARIVHADRPAWDVQTVDDYDGYRSVFIEPSILGEKQTVLFISGTAQRLELFEAHDDDLTLISVFTDIEALGARLLGITGPQ